MNVRSIKIEFWKLEASEGRPEPEMNVRRLKIDIRKFKMDVRSPKWTSGGLKSHSGTLPWTSRARNGRPET